MNNIKPKPVTFRIEVDDYVTLEKAAAEWGLSPNMFAKTATFQLIKKIREEESSAEGGE